MQPLIPHSFVHFIQNISPSRAIHSLTTVFSKALKTLQDQTKPIHKSLKDHGVPLKIIFPFTLVALGITLFAIKSVRVLMQKAPERNVKPVFSTVTVDTTISLPPEIGSLILNFLSAKELVEKSADTVFQKEAINRINKEKIPLSELFPSAKDALNYLSIQGDLIQYVDFSTYSEDNIDDDFLKELVKNCP
ncbi:MAG TPA: hypothetical protein PLC42_04740, partial [Parachlamydiaceae bacterium]|nr:hypothetical protein [Parachlamydiaceae bacterium]